MANYTYTVNSITGAIGTTAGTQTITAVLSPKSGYRLVAADFSIASAPNFENIEITQQGANVEISFDLIDSIVFTSGEINVDIDIQGDARSSTVIFNGDLDFTNDPTDGWEIIVIDNDNNVASDGVLNVDTNGDTGDQNTVGVIVIKAADGQELPEDPDGNPIEPNIDLPSPYSLGGGDLIGDEWFFDVIVTIPEDNIIGQDNTVSTDDITDSNDLPINTTSDGITNTGELEIYWIKTDTSGLDGLNGGFIVVTAGGDPGASGTFTFTPTVEPATSSASYNAITEEFVIGEDGFFRSVVRIPSAAGDDEVGNAICTPETPEDVDDISWEISVDTDDDTSDPDTTQIPEAIKQKGDSKITIEFICPDNNVPQSTDNLATIGNDWRYTIELGPAQEGGKSAGGTINIEIPPPSGGSWDLNGTLAENLANEVKLIEGEEIVLRTPDSDPGIDFCKGKAIKLLNGNLYLVLEYSEGTFQTDDSLYEIPLVANIAYSEGAVILNFSDGDNYSVSSSQIVYSGQENDLVTGANVSVVLTANEGYTWHDTDLDVNIGSFVQVDHSQTNIGSVTLSPTVASFQGLAFDGTPSDTITVNWTLQGNYGASPVVYNFTPTGEPKAISTISFNLGNDNRGANEAQETISINELTEITNVESRGWSKNYTLSSDDNLFFDNPHLVNLTASGSNTINITGPNLVGSGPAYTELNGTISGTHSSNNNLINVNITGNAYIDTDLDGDPDITDTDDDNDGVDDTSDVFPLDSTRSEIIFNTAQEDISSTAGNAIDVSFVLNHTIDAVLIPSGDNNITFSYEGTEITTTTNLPYSDGTTTLRVQIPQSNNFDGSTAGVLRIQGENQEDIVINILQTEIATTFATTSPDIINHPNTGATGETISVNTNNPGLEWTAVSSDPSVVTITSGSSGTSSGLVTYNASPNGFDASATSATVTLSAPGQTDIVITINVAVGIVTTFTTTANSIINYANTGATGETITVNTNNPGLEWTATTSNSDVVNITAGTSGTGDGSVTYTAVANEFDDPATSATITLSAEGFANIVITINVAAGVATTFSTTSASTINYTDTGAIGETISVNTNNPGLEWTATSSDPNIVTITSGGSGNGNGTVTYSAFNTSEPGGDDSTATITLSAEGFDDIVITVNISASEITFLIEGLSSDYTDNTPIASSETNSSISIGSNKSTLTWAVIGSLDPDNILTITTFSGDLQTDLNYTTSANAVDAGSKSASIIIGYFDNGVKVESRNLVVNLPEGANAPVEFDFYVYEAGTTNPVTSLSFDDFIRPVEVDVYIDSEIGEGGFTAALASGSEITQTGWSIDTSLNLIGPSSFDITPTSGTLTDAEILAIVNEFNDSINNGGTATFEANGVTFTTTSTIVQYGNNRIRIGGLTPAPNWYLSGGESVVWSYAGSGAAKFTITPESGEDGTNTMTITPVSTNTSGSDIVDTLTITSVSHPTSSIEIGLTQVGYTTISVEAVDFDITAAPTSTPLAFRFTSNNSTAGWRQAGDGTGAVSTIPAEFAVPETTPEGAFVLRGGSFANNPEFTFELPTPTTSGTQTLTAEWSAIRLLEPPEGIPNVAPNRQYDDYLDANGTVVDSITITTAALAWSVSESSINLTSIGASAYGIDITINDRRVAWTAVSSDNSLVTLAENAGGTGSGELQFSVPPSAPGANAYSETITLSAPNLNDIVVTINVAAAPAFEFTITPNYYSKKIANINSTGNILLLDVNDNATTWTAVSSSENLVITGGSSGVGDGTVTYSIIEDTGIVDVAEAFITLSAPGIDDVLVTLEISNPDEADLTINRSGVVSYNGEAIDKTFEVSHTRDIGVEIPGEDVSVYIDDVLATSNTTVVNSSGLTQKTRIRVVVAAQSLADLIDSIVFTSTGLNSKTVNVKQFIGSPEFTATVSLDTKIFSEQVIWEAAYNDWITNPPIDKTITSYPTRAAAIANGVTEGLILEKGWYGQLLYFDIRPHPENPSILKGAYPMPDQYGEYRITEPMSEPWYDEYKHTIPYIDFEHEFPDSFTVDSSAQNLQIWGGPNGRITASFVYFRGNQWENYMPTEEDLWVHLGTRDDLSYQPRSYNVYEYYKRTDPNQFARLIQMNHYHEESISGTGYRVEIIGDDDLLWDNEIVLFIEENTTNAIRTFEVPLYINNLSKTLTIIQKASGN